MKNLQKLICLKVILFSLFTVVKAQTPSVNLQVLKTDSLITACAENLFTAKFFLSGTQHIKIKANIAGASSSCNQSLKNNVIIVPQSSSNLIIDSASVDTTQGTYTAKFTAITNDTVYFIFHSYIDCNVIANTGNSQTINLSLKFTETANLVTYNVNNSGSDSLQVLSISLPDIADNSPSNYKVYHGDTLNVYNYYKNSGGGGILNAAFSFLADTANYCHQLTPVSLMYRTTGTNFISFIDTASIALKQGDTLIIRRQLLDSTCLYTCNTSKSIFKWRCRYNAGVTTGVTCSSCKNPIITNYNASNSNDSVKIERLLPSTASNFYDSTCMNDVASMVTWQYRITKPDAGAVDSLIIDLFSKSNGGPTSLSLIPVQSLVVTRHCTSCQLDTVIIKQDTNSLCSQYVPQSLATAQLRVLNFHTGDTVLVEFRTLKCAEENNTALLNTGKYYNQWALAVRAKTICNLDANTYATPGTYPFATQYPYINGSSVIYNLTTTYPNIDQKLLFTPTISNLIVPADSLFGDYATMDVELKGLFPYGDVQLAGCTTTPCTLQGYIRATVHCDVGLRMNIDSLATAAKFSYFNFNNGSTIYNYPIYYHTAVPNDTCMAGDYYFYYNLSSPNIKLMLDSGMYSYTIQACCAGAAQSSYNVSFHIMLNPNGNCAEPIFPPIGDTLPPTYTNSNYSWLPCSSAGDIIESQCPGCYAVGCIAENYRMYRTSYGLQSSLNNGIGDSTNTIVTPGTQWYTNYGSQLKPQHSTFTDLVEDVLTARFQDGDSSQGIGYTYAQMTAPTAQAILHYLQLAREIPHALDTVRLTPYEFTLYIDERNSLDTNCIDCNQFKTIGTNFRTQQIIHAVGNDILKYLDTLVNENIYFYSFSTFNTAGNLTGNLHNAAALTDTASYIWVDSISPFTGFKPFQIYRLKVKYRENGVFAARGNPPTSLNNVSKRAAIKNRMWFSGDSLAYDGWSTNQMPNTVATANAAGWSFNSGDPNYISQTFANSYAFWCEFTGGFHTFFSQEANNNATYVNDASCTKTMGIGFTSTIAGGIINAFPYEYKPSSLWAQQYNVKIPQGYQVDSAYSRVRAFNGNSSINMLVPFTAPTTQQFTINDNIFFPQPHCYLANSTPSATNQLVYNLKAGTGREIILYINPDNCKNDTGVVIPADTSALANSTVITTFNKITYPCFTPNATVLTPSLIDTIHKPQSPVVLINKPNLSVSYNPSLIAKNRIICDTLSISNAALTSPQISTAANHVFLALPNAQTVNWLTNWRFVSGNTTINPIGNVIIPLTNQLASGSTINGLLCAEYIDCLDSNASFDFYVGWNCDTFPVATADTANFCGYIKQTVNVTNASYVLSSPVKIIPDSFGLCKPFIINAQFTATQSGSYYPDSVKVYNIAPNLQVQQITISKCNSSTIDTLSGTALTRPISLADMAAINFTDGGFSNSQCLQINVTLKPLCGFQDNIYLPSIRLYSKNACGERDSTVAPFTNIDSSNIFPIFTPAIAWDSTSACSNCFTLTKTASPSSVVVGDTVTFNIEVCSHNAGNDSIYLTEQFPSSSVFTLVSINPFPVNNNNFPPDTCINYIVKGKYTDVGSCPNNNFSNKVTLVSGPATYRDTVCVDVVQPCWAPGTLVWKNNLQTSNTLINTFYTNTNIIIEDTLIINDSLHLRNCNVYTYAGAYISITATGRLVLDSTIIQACDTMWHGIKLKQDAKIWVRENSTIADADTAIFANHKSEVYMYFANILNNVIGVAVPQKNGGGSNNVILEVSGTLFKMALPNFKPDYIGQLSHHPNYPKAGMQLEDGTFTFMPDYTNYFYNMNTGILGKRTDIFISNAHFQDIRSFSWYGTNANGVAIYSEGTNTKPAKLVVQPVLYDYVSITNALKGIGCEKTDLYAQQVSINNSTTGIYVLRCIGQTTTIFGCNINVKASGVQIQESQSASAVEVAYNNITVNNATNSKCINIDQPNRTNTHSYEIHDNILTATQGTGIYCNTINFANIYGNSVKMAGNTVGGIYLTSSDSSTITCNTVYGRYPVQTFQNKGIYLGTSKGNNVTCNTVDSTYRGVEFQGVCGITTFKGNTINKHYVGLYLGSSATIDQQPIGGTPPYHGNTWLDTLQYNSGFGAVNMNAGSLGTLQASLFSTNQTNSIYNPKIPLNVLTTPFYVNNTGWFDPQTTGSTFTCQSASICATSYFGEGSQGLRMSIAEGNDISSDYVDETKMIAQQSLYDEIKANPSLTVNNTVLDDFESSNQNTSIGLLHNAKDIMELIDQSPSLQPTWQSALSSLHTFSDSIRYIDSLYKNNSSANYILLRQLIINGYDNALSTLYALSTQNTAQDITNINNAVAVNASVIPFELPDTYEQIINSIQLEYELNGVTVLQTNYQQLYTIATDCPLAGGPAVYRARALLGIIDDTIEYTDELTCAQYGYARKAFVSKNNDIAKIRVIPNPANEYIEVRLKDPEEGICKISIQNAQGLKIFTGQFICNQSKYTIFTNSFATGVYTLSVRVNNSILENVKLVIIR